MSHSYKTLSLTALFVTGLFSQVAQAAPTVTITFKNHTSETATIRYLHMGNRTVSGSLAPGGTLTRKSWTGIYWEIFTSTKSMGRTVTKAGQLYELGTKPETIRPRPFDEGLPPVNSTRTNLPLNKSVLRYAKSMTRLTVGQGHSADLVFSSLKSANAQLPALGTDWGQKLSNHRSLQPGDIIQMSNVRFTTGISRTHHAAVVLTLRGSLLRVLEQIGPGSKVQEATYDLSKVKAGTLSYYRPIPPAPSGGSTGGVTFGDGDVKVRVDEKGITIGDDDFGVTFDF